MVEYLKYNFFARYTQFDSFAHVNQLLEQWLAEVADQRELRQFRQTPAIRFGEEKRTCRRCRQRTSIPATSTSVT